MNPVFVICYVTKLHVPIIFRLNYYSDYLVFIEKYKI